MPYTEGWVEGAPDGAIIGVSSLDDWIRKTKVAIRERLEDPADNKGIIEVGSWATGPVMKAGSARAYFVTAAGIAGLPLQDGRLAVTTDTNTLYHLSSGGPIALFAGGGGVPAAGGTFTGPVNFSGALADNAQIRMGEIATIAALNLKDNIDHTQLVFCAPNVNMIACSNTDGSSAQWTGTKRHNMLAIANSDGGMRLWMNFKQTNVGFGTGETNRPQAVLGLDSAGTFSYQYTQPTILGVGLYSGIVSQTFVISGAGQASVAYEETVGVSLMTMQGTRTMDFYTSNVTNAPYMAMQITAHVAGGPGNVNIFRQLVVGGIAGVANIRLQNSGAPTPAAGVSYLWFDGTNVKVSAGVAVAVLV